MKTEEITPALKTRLEEYFGKYLTNEAYVVQGTRVFTDKNLAVGFAKRQGLKYSDVETIYWDQVVETKVAEPTKEEKVAAAKMAALTKAYKEETGNDVPPTWTAEDIEAELALVPKFKALGVDIKKTIGNSDLEALLAAQGDKQPELTVADLKAKLDALGVPYAAKAKKSDLEELLAKAKEAEAEAAQGDTPPAPAEGGTGSTEGDTPPAEGEASAEGDTPPAATEEE